DSEGRREDHRLRVARAGRIEPGALARGHLRRRQEVVLRPARRNWRWQLKLGAIFAALLAFLAIAVPQNAQTQKPVPRTPDGHPDFSGVWQGGGAGGLTFAVGAENAKAVRTAPAPKGTVARDPVPYQDWV